MVYRIDVQTTPEARGGQAAVDPLGEAVRHQIEEFGTRVGPIHTSRIFLIDSSTDRTKVERAARELLADPIVESAQLISGATSDNGNSRVEIHLKPGVMDPVAASTEMALRDMGVDVREVRTGRAYVIEGKLPREELARIASRVLANGVIESVHFDAYVPEKFETGRTYDFKLRHVPLRNLTDEQLQKLSRDGHLFLSLAEMKAIQTYFRRHEREPTDIELETLAQTWSEHCVHKTLKSAVDVEVRDAAGKIIETRHYDNLIKETIFASTMELMGEKREKPEARSQKPEEIQHVGSASADVAAQSSVLSPQSYIQHSAFSTQHSPQQSALSTQHSPAFCLSVFADNAGVIAFDDVDAVCFKVETHNHPSAIEPYGGSATGAGGVIRDILGTGLAAKPIANTDVFCVAFPGAKPVARSRKPEGIQHVGSALADVSAQSSVLSPQSSPLPRGVIHPKRILQQVVAGVRDYGNRMGIPTLNGAVYFDDRYLGNPLVFCGCVGLIPRDKINKSACPGDAIVVMGGRTGRDGIHGATFSSAELTDTHADEFSHAVQIGNAITEKKMADVILQARDRDLFSAITDCGAGGLSSAIGEMGEKIGASMQLDRVPLKYAGLRYDEIWISEAQERMVLSVPREKLQELLELSAGEDVEATVIGEFGTPNRDLILHYQGHEVGRLSMEFLHHGIPMPTRKAVVQRSNGPQRGTGFQSVQGAPQVGKTRTPDNKNHGLKTRATIKDQILALLAHPNIASKHWIIRQYDHEVQGGSVIKPLVGPLQIGPSDASVIRPKLDSYRGVVIGCGMAPHIEDPYEMALASIDEAIRNVVAVGADPSRIAILDNFCWPSVEDEQTMGTLVRACEACRDAALAYRIPFISGKDSLHNQFTDSETGRVIRIPNTLLISAIGIIDNVRQCVTMDLKKPGNDVALVRSESNDLAHRITVHRQMAHAIREGFIASCHDVSDGGQAVALAEMCIASGLGVDWAINDDSAFREEQVQYLIECKPGSKENLKRLFRDSIQFSGRVEATPRLRLMRSTDTTEIPVAELTSAWRGTLDW